MQKLTGFPWDDMPASSAVDVLGLRAGRPGIRVPAPTRRRRLELWCRNHHLAVVMDDKYAVVARTVDRAQSILAVDTAPYPHETILGFLLGYPRCCASAAAAWTEERIDVAAAAAAAWPLAGEWKLIAIDGYRLGIAVISHVPCSPHCATSLRLARHNLEYARTAGDGDERARWKPILQRFDGAVDDSGRRRGH